MTPTHPLTPSENAEINAAIKAACAELDDARLGEIDTLDCRAIENFNLGLKEIASAMFLVARTLAQQMAARL